MVTDQETADRIRGMPSHYKSLFKPFVIASIEAGKWNEMQFFIGKCTTEKDLEKLKELRGKNIKENVAKALDQHFEELQSRGKR